MAFTHRGRNICCHFDLLCRLALSCSFATHMLGFITKAPLHCWTPSSATLHTPVSHHSAQHFPHTMTSLLFLSPLHLRANISRSHFSHLDALWVMLSHFKWFPCPIPNGRAKYVGFSSLKSTVQYLYDIISGQRQAEWFLLLMKQLPDDRMSHLFDAVCRRCQQRPLPLSCAEAHICVALARVKAWFSRHIPLCCFQFTHSLSFLSRCRLQSVPAWSSTRLCKVVPHMRTGSTPPRGSLA